MFPFNAGRFGNLAALSGSGSVIKSIQQGSITLAATVTSGTYTCSPTVTAANSMLVHNGLTTDNAGQTNYNRTATYITLTNGTTVTATRGSGTTAAVTINFTIVEFASGVNSIQYGTITNTSQATNTATISAVGATAFVIWLGTSTTGSGLSFSDITTAVQLTNSTTVTASATNTAITIITSFVVVDLTSSIVSSIQQRGPIASTIGATTDTDTITSVTTGNTLLFFNGETEVVTLGAITDAYNQQLTNSTTVTFTRNSGSGTQTRSHYYTAVVFAASALNGNVQRSTIALTAQASNTATITSIDTTKSFVNYGWFQGSSVNANVLWSNLVLTNATTVTASLSASGSTTTAYEVLQFA